MLELNTLYHLDCMEGMAQFPDKYFELAIVDPPYMDNIDEYMGMQTRMGGVAKTRIYNNISNFNKPDRTYFDALKRVSKNQIVWGFNHYGLDWGSGRIIWDKRVTGQYNHCEIAYHSTSNAIRIFRYTWNGMLQENMKDKDFRIHPTQKPVALYKWLLTNYAKPGDKILDTHVGSASSLIACYDMGFEYIGFEIDKDYYEAAQARLNRHKAQVRLDIAPVAVPIQQEIEQPHDGQEPQAKGV